MSNEKKTEEVVDLGRKVIKLTKPEKYEDAEVSELVLNFNSLTGKDSEEAQAERDALAGGPSMFIDGDKVYLGIMAAKAAGVPYGLIQNLPVKTHRQVTQAVQGFLFG
jgi:hypothetical protein